MFTWFTPHTYFAEKPPSKLASSHLQMCEKDNYTDWEIDDLFRVAVGYLFHTYLQ